MNGTNLNYDELFIYFIIIIFLIKNKSNDTTNEHNLFFIFII